MNEAVTAVLALLGAVVSALLLRSSGSSRTLARAKEELEVANLLSDNHRHKKLMMDHADASIWQYRYLREHAFAMATRAVGFWLWVAILVVLLTQDLLSRSDAFTGPNKEVWLRLDDLGDKFRGGATLVALVALGWTPLFLDEEVRDLNQARSKIKWAKRKARLERWKAHHARNRAAIRAFVRRT